MKIIRKAGDTSNILQVFIQDSSSTVGAGLTGLAFGTSGLTAYYHKDTDTTATVISLVTMTVGTFTSLGFKEIDATNMPGWYQFCPPDAALSASGTPKSVGFHLKGASNMAPLAIEVQLVSVDVQDATAFGLSRIDGTITSRMATYTQPTGFLAATFPSGTVANTTNITSITGNITGNLSGSVGSVTGAVASVTGNVGGNVTGSVGSVAGAVGSVTGNIGGNVVGSVASVTAGVTVTTNNDKTGYTASTVSDKTGYALTAGERDSISDALLDRTSGIETSRTLRQSVRLMLAALAGKASGMATTTATFRDTNDSKNRIVATVDADGNRSAVTLDAS